MSDAEALFRQVVAAYAEEGFPHEIIGQWTLPASDVADLVHAIRTEAPRTVLEVGTFVGLSTMLIALAGGGRTRVLSIDPNFPIEVEMRGMDSALGSIDATRPTQEIARAVAARLGIADRLDFVAGGFSSGSTFAARRQDPDLRVPVVGPEVCAARGPFDLAFIDGLHYADVVAGDVALASRHVGPSGVVLMHDCVGMWGTNVRAGIGRFLAGAPDWQLLHPPYADLYRSIGTLFRPAARPDLAAALRQQPGLTPHVASLCTALATAVLRQTGARRILELHAGTPMLAEAFAPLIDVEAAPIDAKMCALHGRLFEVDPAATLVVSAGGPDTLDDDGFAALFAALGRAGAQAMFLRTPPGEAGAACRFSRPLARWVAEASRAGLTLREWPPLLLAPSTFLFRKDGADAPVSSALCNVLLATPWSGDAHLPGWRETPPVISAARAEIIEQNDLIAVHYGCGFRNLFAESAAAAATLAERDRVIAERDGQLAAAGATIAERDRVIAERDGQLAAAGAAIAERDRVIAERDGQLAAAGAAIAERDRVIAERDAQLARATAKTLRARIMRLRHLGGRIGRGLRPFRSAAGTMGAPAPSAREALIASAISAHRRLDSGRLAVLIDGTVTSEERERWQAEPAVAVVYSREEFERARNGPATPGAAATGAGVVLPAGCHSLYFIGSPRALTRHLLAQAWRLGVYDLRVAVAGVWIRLNLSTLQRAHRMRVGLHCRLVTLKTRVHRSREDERTTALLPRGIIERLPSMDAAVATMLARAQPGSDASPGRIILVCGNLAPGGAERQVANTLIGLARAGFNDVSLLAHALDSGPARHDFHLQRVVDAGIPAREIERTFRSVSDPAIPSAVRDAGTALPEALLVDIANLVVEFRRARPEIVHAWLDWDCVRAGLAAAMAGVPRIVLSGRNLAPYHFALYQPYMDPAYRGLAKLANVQWLNNSRAGADNYADWIGIARDRIRVIYNGIDADGRGPPSERARAAERLRHGLPQDALVIGGVFRFAAEKDPLLWLDAAALIAQRQPSARFILFGQGHLQAEMRERAATAGIADRVTFAGVTDDPMRAMGMMDVFLLTSYGEGLPNVLIEAQAMGTAVVCTAAGGAPEAVAEGITGTVVRQRDAAAIAEAVLALLADGAALSRARCEGPRFVRTKFGMARMIAETIEAYGLAMPRGAPPREPPALGRDPASQPVRALGAA